MKRNTIVKTAFSMLSEEEARAIYELTASVVRSDGEEHRITEADYELLRKFVEKTERTVYALEEIPQTRAERKRDSS